jgi:hypothetical protein
MIAASGAALQHRQQQQQQQRMGNPAGRANAPVDRRNSGGGVDGLGAFAVAANSKSSLQQLQALFCSDPEAALALARMYMTTPAENVDAIPQERRRGTAVTAVAAATARDAAAAAIAAPRGTSRNASETAAVLAQALFGSRSGPSPSFPALHRRMASFLYLSRSSCRG